MKTIEATYRIVTPMFCAGADQSGAELRLPSFKGALRFWWRSLAWRRGMRNAAQLREAEARLFGSSDQGRSRILLRCMEELSKVSIESHNGFDSNTWQGYIGYGIGDRRPGRRQHRIAPGSTWTIQLLGTDLSPEEIESVRSALIALGLLGGLGARSRKGWGSLTLVRLAEDGEDEGSGSAWRVPTTYEELRLALESLFHTDDRDTDLPPWTAITSRSSFAIGPACKDANAAHQYLAERYRRAIRSITCKVEREQFGLPRGRAGKNADCRRASPVFLHVHQADDNEAIPVAAVLPADFLPRKREPAGGWRLLESFLESVEE